MTVVRRGLILAVITVGAGIVIRLRGRESAPAPTGGWRVLDAPDFR